MMQHISLSKPQIQNLRFSPRVTSNFIERPQSLTCCESVLAFSIAKAGSTLLYNLLSEVCGHVGLVYFSPEDSLFAANVSASQRTSDVGDIFSRTGYCYGGFRHFPSYAVPILDTTKVVFLVRNPLDMAVSLYFSLLKSHRLPDDNGIGGVRQELLEERQRLQETDIETFVIRSASLQYIRMFEGYIAQGFHWRKNVVTYRYEDIIYSKAEWLKDICDFYGWSVSFEIISNIAARYDVIPDSERSAEHVRQVIPGNYHKYLSVAAIEEATAILGEYMPIFGY
jgi:hypothetical protein